MKLRVALLLSLLLMTGAAYAYSVFGHGLALPFEGVNNGLPSNALKENGVVLTEGGLILTETP